MTRYWRCRRVTAGQVCGELNLAVKKKCYRCGKPKPRRRKHALDLPYDVYEKLNGGDFCGICGTPRKQERKLDRDHDHSNDKRPRGLLCNKCNQGLNGPRRFGLVVTPDWLRSAAAYLERAA